MILVELASRGGRQALFGERADLEHDGSTRRVCLNLVARADRVAGLGGRSVDADVTAGARRLR